LRSQAFTSENKRFRCPFRYIPFLGTIRVISMKKRVDPLFRSR
jgi:hypothetical protein